MRAAPNFGPDLMAGKQRILSGEADWPDGVLDRIGVQFEAALVEEACESLPMSEPIADVFGQPGARGDHRQLLFEPRFQGGDDRRGMLLSCGEPRLGRAHALASTA